MAEDFKCPEKAAEYLGVTRAMLYKYAKAGRLKIYKQKGNAKLSFFSKAELDIIKEEKENPQYIAVEDLEVPSRGTNKQHLAEVV